jgi:predicted Zn-dependent protease
MRQNRRAEALVCFQQAIRQDATDWQAHLNLGNFFLSENDRDKAIPELQETLRLKPSCEPARRALARAQSQAQPGSR